MKVVGTVLAGRLYRTSIAEMQFGIVPDNGTINAAFILMFQEMYHA